MTAAGWYDDGQGQLRYWDGTQWTEHTAPLASSEPIVAPPLGAEGATPGFAAPASAGPRKSPAPVIIAVVVGLLVLAVGVIVAALLVFRAAETSSDVGADLENGPESAFAELSDAWMARDCAAENALLSSAYRDLTTAVDNATETDYCLGADYTWVDELSDWSIEITGSTVSGAEATVTTRETYTWEVDGVFYDEIWDYSFVLEDGKWLLDDAQFVE